MKPQLRGANCVQAIRGACQARVLEEWRRSAMPLEVHLDNGPRIHCMLLAFDRFMIALPSQGELQGIYRHAILTILPGGSVSSDHRAIQRPNLKSQAPRGQ
jgi:host factor-I protein